MNRRDGCRDCPLLNDAIMLERLVEFRLRDFLPENEMANFYPNPQLRYHTIKQVESFRAKLENFQNLQASEDSYCMGPKLPLIHRLAHDPNEVSKNESVERQVQLAFYGKCAIKNVRKGFLNIVSQPLYRQWVLGDRLDS